MNRAHYVFIIFLIGNTVLFGKLDPTLYNKTNSVQFEHALREIVKLDLDGSETVLDIGSGDGTVSKYIRENYLANGKLTGIDKSAEMVEFAQLHNSGLNITYECANAAEYSAENSFDAIISFWTLHWITDQYEKVLANIACSLKPGGKALLCHVAGVARVCEIAQELLNTEKWSIYKKNSFFPVWPSLIQIVSAIDNSKLAIENLEVKEIGTWMNIDDVIHNWVALSFCDFIPIEPRKQFFREVLEVVIKSNPLNEEDKFYRTVPIVSMVLKKSDTF